MTPSATSTDAARLADLLSQAERAVVLTGAGISVPSGIPDFRTPGKGLWEKVDPMKVAHIDAFRRSPDEFWTFYGQRFAMLSRDPARTRRTTWSPSSSGAASCAA